MMLTDESDDANSHRYTFFMTWRVRIWNSFPLIKYIYDYLSIIEIHGYIVNILPHSRGWMRFIHTTIICLND